MSNIEKTREKNTLSTMKIDTDRNTQLDELDELQQKLEQLKVECSIHRQSKPYIKGNIDSLKKYAKINKKKKYVKENI